MSKSTFLTSLFQYKAWANEELFPTLKTLEEGTHQVELDLATRLLNHVYVVDRIFCANLQQTRHAYTGTNTEETPTLDSLFNVVRETDRWYVEYVASLSSQALAENIDFTFVDGARGRMSREEMLAHVVTHGGYHRGEVGRILAQLSIARPHDVFTGYLHKVEPVRREQI